MFYSSYVSESLVFVCCQIFSGNNNNATKKLNTFKHAVHAKCVRILPVTWSLGICLNFDLIGCLGELKSH